MVRSIDLIGLSLMLLACGEVSSGFDAALPRDAGTAVVQDAGATDAGAGEDAGSELRWRAAAPLAGGPRQETAVVVWQGEVVVIGGYDEAAAFGTDVEAYDPGADAWRQLPDLPVPMHHPNAAAIDDTLWVLGFLGAGFQEDGRIFTLSVGATAWRARGALPSGRARGASVVAVYDGAIYLVGGLANGLPVADTDRFDPETEQWRPLPPIPRRLDHAVGGVIGDALYVAGGRAGLIDSHVPRLDVLDLGSFEWRVGPPMPTARGGAAGAVLQGELFVIGGEGNPDNPPSNLFGAVESFDPAAGEWRTHPPLSPPRHGMGAAVLAGQIWVPGGADVQAFGAVATHARLGP